MELKALCGRTTTKHGKVPFTDETLALHQASCSQCKMLALPVDDGIPQKGWWYELIDFSERDYGSSWGYYLYHNGEKVYSSGGLWSRISSAGDAAREHKERAKTTGKA